MLKCERASCGGKDCGAAVHGRETVGKMEKFSVKKPFTVLVAVVMVLILGFVAITKMQTNLLPDVSTPYLMVVTVYPGASPERVESEVSDVTAELAHSAGRVQDHRNIGRKLQPAADGVYRGYGYEQRAGQGVQQAGSGQKRPAQHLPDPPPSLSTA